MDWLSAGASLLGKAMADAPSTTLSGVGGQSSVFDASGFVVNFGNDATVSPRAGGGAVVDRNAPSFAATQSVSPWLIGGAALIAVVGVYWMVK